MKYICIFLCSLLVGELAHGQYSLRGSVSVETGTVVAGATVTLRQGNTSRSMRTDSLGVFRFQGLTKGRYQIAVTSVGYYPYLEVLQVDERYASQAIVIKLTPALNELQTVEVTGRPEKKYNSDYSFVATKMAVLNKDLPQSINTVTKELIADRQAFQLADAVKIASGVIPSSFYNQYAIRGVSQNEEGQIINGMRTRQHYFLQPLTAHIERVEVLKGPASVTLSSVDPGGSINLVTKKPLATDRKTFSVSAGSFSTLRATLDFTGPLNKEKTLLYRLNAAYQQAQSYRDLVRNNALLLTPSVSYIPNERTAMNVEIILSDMEGNLDRGQPIFGAVAGQTDLRSTPISLNLAAPNDFYRSKEFIVTGSFSHKFSKRFAFNASYMKQTWAEDLREHRTNNAFAVDEHNNPVTSLVAMQFIQREQFWNIDNVSGYFNADYKTGSIQHKVLFGYDLQAWHKTKGGGQNTARGFILVDGSTANTYDPANPPAYEMITIDGITMPRPNVDHFRLDNPEYVLKDAAGYVLNARTALPAAMTTSQAVYVQEQLQWGTFTLLLSLRREWFKDITGYRSPGESSFTNEAWIPRIGLTWAVTPAIRLYGTYLEGFQPQSNTVTLMPNTGNFYNSPKSASRFKPLISDLKEVGLKAEAFKGRLSITASVYEINQQNLLLPANLPAYPDSLVTRGAERSRGFETDITGFILPNWQVNASYSYIDAVIVEDNDPALEGARKQNTPYHSAHLWTRYNFPRNTILQAFGIGAGIQHSGNKVPWFTRSFVVPGYTLMDMAVYYTPDKSALQWSVKVNNLTGVTHWIGAQHYVRLFPGAPRHVLFTATYHF